MQGYSVIFLAFLLIALIYVGLLVLACAFLWTPRTRPGGLILLSGLLIPAVWVAYLNLEQWSMDREVDALCAKDGGVRIYERVRLSKENFGPNGELFPQYRFARGEHLGPHFRLEHGVRTLVAGKPKLTRYEIRVYRKSDNQLLGEMVDYTRSGGHLPLPALASTKSCTKTADQLQFPNSLFVPEE